MKVSSQRIEKSQVVLNVEIEPEELERSLEKAYRRLANKTLVPGFRKGKAPRFVLERYLGKAALLDDALDHLIPEAYQQALREQEIDAIAEPRLEVTGTDPVAFTATVPVRPTVELGDYHQIRLDPPPVEISDEAVDTVLQQLRSRHARWEPVERPAQFGDQLTMNLEGTIDDNPTINEKGLIYFLLKDFPVPVPGFGEELVGMEKGQEKEIRFSFPDDHENKDLAGKKYFYGVTITEIKEETLPELDDEFAKGVGEGFDSLEQLRERICADLRAQGEGAARRELAEQAIEAVVGLAQIDFPDVLVEREIERLLEEQERRLRENRIRVEDYLRSINKTPQELREELRPVATKRVTHSLVLEKLAEAEGIQVDDTEIDAEVEAMAQRAGEQGEEVRRLFSTAGGRYSLRQMILTRKTVGRLAEIVQSKAETGEEVAEGV